MGRSKRFLVWRKNKRRKEKARLKVKLYEKGQLKREELPRLARKLLAKRPRHQAAPSAA